MSATPVRLGDSPHLSASVTVKSETLTNTKPSYPHSPARYNNISYAQASGSSFPNFTSTSFPVSDVA
jgi:hypothetical protein